jgi:hypothetical protein
MSLGLLATPTVQICKAAKMMFNIAPGNFYLAQYLEYDKANGTSATINAMAKLVAGTDAAFVTSVLTNLGLASDAGASAFLTSAIASGSRGSAVEAAITALNNVAATDATYGTAKTNFDKVAVASVTYSTNVANTTTSTAEADPVAVTAAATAAAATAITGKSYSLTDSTVTGKFDNYVGTTGADTFQSNASNLLLTGDVLDGGAGIDSVNSRHTVSAALTVGADMKNIENHKFRVDADGGAADVVTYDTSDMTGIASIVIDRAINTGSTADPIVTLSGNNLTTSVGLTIKGGDAGADNSSVDVTATYAAVTGSADAISLTLNGAGANVLTIAAIETINMALSASETSVSTSGASDINSFQAANVTALNITGAGAVNLSGTSTTFIAANLAATVTVTATDNTGGVTMQSEANTLTFTGGTGPDTLYMVATTTAADSLDGGAGTDTIGLTADVTSTVGAVISNFEVLDLVDGLANTWDMDDYANSSFTTIALSGRLSGNVVATVNDIVDGGTLRLGGAEAITANDDITLSVKNAGVAGQSNNSLNIEFTGTGAVDFGTLIAPNIENVTIAAGGALTGNSVAVFTMAAARTLTLTGASDLEITAFTSSAAITNFDASGMSGDFVMGAQGVATGATLFTGGTGSDTMIGNAGDDVFVSGTGTTNSLQGSTGDDDYTLGSGVDTVVASGTSDSTAPSATTTIGGQNLAAADTITFGNGVDVVNGFTAGAGGDVLDRILGTAAITAIGVQENLLTNAKNFFLSGAYVKSTGVFTVAADGTGADTLTFTANNASHANTTDIMENEGHMVLVGVDSDDLIAANFS